MDLAGPRNCGTGLTLLLTENDCARRAISGRAGGPSRLVQAPLSVNREVSLLIDRELVSSHGNSVLLLFVRSAYSLIGGGFACGFVGWASGRLTDVLFK
jgi:hypothetical protein